MTQAERYALVKAARNWPMSRVLRSGRPNGRIELRALGIYGKRTLRAKLKQVDSRGLK